MFNENELKNIQKGLEPLKENISLMFFTDFKTSEDGSKTRRCMMCDGTLNLLDLLAKNSGGKLEIKEYSTEEQPEEAQKFNITKIPTILFLDEDGKELIRYMANPMGSELAPFIETLRYYSGVSSFYKDAILSSLKNVQKSTIKLFMTLTCPYCPAVIPILNLIAILSKGKIKVEIIDTNMNPDLAIKYNVQGVPHTVINEKDQLIGAFTPQDLLEKLTKGKRDYDGMYS
ncbi:MAG: thioredoxin family protein [Candidatus Lokiarchaeota archaeon]|nr:thioredoxin family protein [Candidatus Lokiarchaeota archaeon]